MVAFAAPTLHAQITRPFTARFSVNDASDVQLIGNTLETCPASTACTAAQNGTNTTAENNNFNMAYVDVDNDPTTFNSSTATFTLPSGATVVWAGLYRGGYVTAGVNGAAMPNSAAKGRRSLPRRWRGMRRSTGKSMSRPTAATRASSMSPRWSRPAEAVTTPSPTCSRPPARTSTPAGR